MVSSKGWGETIGKALDGLISRLEKTSDIPTLDAQVLLAHLLNRSRSWILTHPEAPLTGDEVIKLEKQVIRLEGGEPLPYILGVWEFFGLELEVTPAVLIPRQETELLVEHAITWLRKSEPWSGKLRVMDIGTGSGCIAIALAVNIPSLIVTATDISPAALRVARNNAERMHVSDRITYFEADLFPNLPIPDPHSLIIANLPYIPTKTLQRIPIYGREPSLALDGGSDGLEIIRSFLKKAPSWLLPGGYLIIEIESSEGPAVQLLANDAFPNAGIHLMKDLAGLDRMLEVQT
ncbi:MAG: peptide chain release factor N(5)-glutamine methyltransferase [Anaerolineales bacterium]|jgi:release factor glutamine methyltransferase